MSVAVEIAQAVADELNAGSFGQEFTAQRLYQPLFELTEMKILHVTVVPANVNIHSGSRGRNQHDYKIEVAVQKKFQADGVADIDPLMDLAEEIADFFRRRRLTSFPTAMWVKTEHAPLFAQEHMEQFRQFTSLITFTYKVMR